MKKLIRLFLQRFGYDIIKFNPPFVRGRTDKKNFLAEHKWLQLYGFKTIVDIGANEGQFSDRMRILFPEARIYAFEPLPGVFERLKRNFAEDTHFEAINLGLGEKEGSIEFWENEYTPSSSFLPLAVKHKQNFEEAVREKKVLVRIDSLDHALMQKQLPGPYMVKIDVQGYEDKVISGGSEILKNARLIVCELSFVELYKGQALFGNVYQQLQELGFAYAGNIEQIYSRDTKEPLQADGIFINQN